MYRWMSICQVDGPRIRWRSVGSELALMLLQPVELCAPPLDIRQSALKVESIDVPKHRLGNRVDHRAVGRSAVGGGEEADPSRLLAWALAVGAEVQPEEDGVPEVLESASGCCGVEVDDRDRSVVAEDEVAR